MKILLVNPPLDIYPGEFISIIPPMGIAYIAAVLEKEGHEVKILDCLALSWRKPQKIKRGNKLIRRFSPSKEFLVKYLKDFHPQIVGISNQVSPSEEHSLKLAFLVKKVLPRCLVVLGGPSASERYEILLKDKNIDFVVIGEGEETMKELVVAIERGLSLKKIKGLVFKEKRKIIVNPPRELIKNLDKLPLPARHLLPMEEYFQGQIGTFWKRRRLLTVLTSRGCPNACIFCTNEKFWRRHWRARSVENVTAEIRYLKKKYRVEEVQFLDSNISVDKERFKKLCLALKKENLLWLPGGGMAVMTIDPSFVPPMAESGCYAIQFGIEHGDPEMQKRIGKIVPLSATKALVAACQKAGIFTLGNFVLGLPGETKKSAQKCFDYAVEANLESASFFIALPLPGSRFYQQLFGNQKGLNLDNLRFYLYRARGPGLSDREIKNIIRTFFKKFFIFRLKRELNPLHIWRRLRQLRSFDDLGFYFRIFKRLFELEMID